MLAPCFVCERRYVIEARAKPSHRLWGVYKACTVQEKLRVRKRRGKRLRKMGSLLSVTIISVSNRLT
jgi:hypothetical protein